MTTTRATSAFLAAAILLSGCAATDHRQYQWGSYTEQQYSALNGDPGAADGINALEETLQESISSGKPVPPGLQAHLGLLYGQAGRHDLFVKYLRAEQQQYPESKAYINFLLNRSQGQKK